MAVQLLENASRRRGRPRDPACDRAILDAARAVLADKGFTGASIEAIARRAGVGKDTIYRRWRSKEDLVGQLLTVLAEEGVAAPAVDDDPRFGLFVFLQDVVRLNAKTDFGPIVAGVVGASARNDVLATRFHAFWAERRRVAERLVRDVVGPQATAVDIARILDQLVGPIYYRLLLSGDPIPDEYLWDLVIAVPWLDEQS